MTWDIHGRTVLVTGATSGLGLEASVRLARLGARVVMVGRNPRRTDAALADVSARSGSREVSALLCDLSSQSDIRRLAETVLERHGRLHVLINNAGGVNKKRRLTRDGIEATFAVNHLASFLLTNLLLERLVRSAPARVVTVASAVHRHGTLALDDPGFERGGYSIMKAYARSKLANVLFAAELARRLAGTGVVSNSVHPGSVATRIWAGAPLWARPFIALVLRPGQLSAERGAEPIVRLAASPELEGVTGRYFDRGRETAPAPLADDADLARRLWDTSAALVRLPSPV